MGHYYSEMVSDREMQEKAKMYEDKMSGRKEKIKQAIEEEGIESVLAQIIDDPTMASIRFRK